MMTLHLIEPNLHISSKKQSEISSFIMSSLLCIHTGSMTKDHFLKLQEVIFRQCWGCYSKKKDVIYT